MCLSYFGFTDMKDLLEVQKKLLYLSDAFEIFSKHIS